MTGGNEAIFTVLMKNGCEMRNLLEFEGRETERLYRT